MDSDDDTGPTKKEYKAENLHPISVANEKQVMVRVRQLCVDALKLYPNSLQDDFDLLK
jgi:hypothetical protein